MSQTCFEDGNQGFILKFIFLKLLMTFKETGSNLLLYYFEKVVEMSAI